ASRARDNAQHPAEPVPRARLQRRRRADRGGGALPGAGHHALAHGCGGGDEPVLGLGDRQRAQAPLGPALRNQKISEKNPMIARMMMITTMRITLPTVRLPLLLRSRDS